MRVCILIFNYKILFFLFHQNLCFSHITEYLIALREKQLKNDINQMSSEKLKELIEENVKIIQEYFDFEIKVAFSKHFKLN